MDLATLDVSDIQGGVEIKSRVIVSDRCFAFFQHSALEKSQCDIRCHHLPGTWIGDHRFLEIVNRTGEITRGMEELPPAVIGAGKRCSD